jgi:hypothetical protein
LYFKEFLREKRPSFDQTECTQLIAEYFKEMVLKIIAQSFI